MAVRAGFPGDFGVRARIRHCREARKLVLSRVMRGRLGEPVHAFDEIRLVVTLCEELVADGVVAEADWRALFAACASSVGGLVLPDEDALDAFRSSVRDRMAGDAVLNDIERQIVESSLTSLARLFVEYALHRAMVANLSIVDGRVEPSDRNFVDLRRLLGRLERRHLFSIFEAFGEAGYRHLGDRFAAFRSAHRLWRAKAGPLFAEDGDVSAASDLVDPAA